MSFLQLAELNQFCTKNDQVVKLVKMMIGKRNRRIFKLVGKVITRLKPRKGIQGTFNRKSGIYL